ncbi:MAG: hypothetical protein HKM93_20285 [Desulfobacteraceae bacterium]|nr:hypothetical protein [Desulfobacteraceae bacterium]
MARLCSDIECDLILDSGKRHQQTACNAFWILDCKKAESFDGGHPFKHKPNKRLGLIHQLTRARNDWHMGGILLLLPNGKLSKQQGKGKITK